MFGSHTTTCSGLPQLFGVQTFIPQEDTSLILSDLTSWLRPNGKEYCQKFRIAGAINTPWVRVDNDNVAVTVPLLCIHFWDNLMEAD
jgi:hypothetical protein